MKRDDKSNKSSLYTLRVEKYYISNGENLCYNCNDYGVLIRSNGLSYYFRDFFFFHWGMGCFLYFLFKKRDTYLYLLFFLQKIYFS